MLEAATQLPPPRNQTVEDYAPGSPDRCALRQAQTERAASPVELTATIGGEQRMAGGAAFDVVAPHRHAQVLGPSAAATTADAQEAVRCAKEAAPGWSE